MFESIKALIDSSNKSSVRALQLLDEAANTKTPSDQPRERELADVIQKARVQAGLGYLNDARHALSAASEEAAKEAALLKPEPIVIVAEPATASETIG